MYSQSFTHHVSVSTVFLKKISPVIGDQLIVTSGIVDKSNPVIAPSGAPCRMRVVWQQRFDEYYLVLVLCQQ